MSMGDAAERESKMRKILIAAGAAAVLVAAGVSTSVEADGVYRTDHIRVQPFDDAPLRTGSVTNIHANGPIVYALEQYHLNGAEPNTTYDIVLQVFVVDEDCEAAPSVEIPTDTFTTNKAGNGHGKARFDPSGVEGLPTAPVLHGANWVFMDGDTKAYATGCQQIVLD